jgi:methyl-accepting chemotaxis protein
VFFIIKPEVLLGPDAAIGIFLSLVVMLNGALVFLFFLNKWGKAIIINATQKEAENLRIVESLSGTMFEVENSTVVLRDNTNLMSENAKATRESSKQVATAMHEVAVGVQEQAESVSDISERVTGISNDVGEAHSISEKLTESNKTMMDEVVEGESQIKHMKSQMTIIDDAIEAAIITVNDLEVSMGDIQNFLGVITSISTQTNLLALNASIESARAGEAGKGFAVVADEIRKLAEQSSASVKDINGIVESVGKKTLEAVETVGRGNVAVDEGAVIIERITGQYGSIKKSFIVNNDELEREMSMIKQINQSFNIVHERISNIASISEEQSASTQEILATIESQDTNIDNLSNSINDINSLSLKLLELVEKNSGIVSK